MSIAPRSSHLDKLIRLAAWMGYNRNRPMEDSMAKKIAATRLTREDWVRGAIEALQERGVDGVKIVVIADRLGVTSGSFYRHFRSKDELVAAVVEFRSMNWARAIEERVAAARTPKRRLMAVFDFLEEFIGARNFRGCALVNASVEVLSPSDAGRKIASRNKQQNRKRLEQLARQAGLPKPRALASALSLLFEGAIVQAYVESDPTAGREARRAAEQLIRSQR